MPRQIAKTYTLPLLLSIMWVICCNHQTVADENNVKREKPKMLMVTQSAGYKHSPVKRGEQLISPAEKTMKQIADQTGLFDVDFSQDAATHLTRENLQHYDIVVFYTSGNLPIGKDDLKYLLEDWVKQPGHGFLGFHSASDTYKDHQPYWEFIGGSFDGHPWGANTKVTIKVHDPTHPAMKPFGTEFEFRDEIYQYDNWQPENVRVLMSLDMEKTERKRPYHVPVAWVKQIGEGRMFYNNLGHRNDTWENEQFQQSIIGAIRWMVGEEPGSASPNLEVSKQQHDHSVKFSHAAGITMESLAAEKRANEARNQANQAKKQAEAEKTNAEAEKQRNNSDKNKKSNTDK